MEVAVVVGRRPAPLVAGLAIGNGQYLLVVVFLFTAQEVVAVA